MNQHLTALQVKLCGGGKTAQQQYQAGIQYVKVVGTPLYNFACQLVADPPPRFGQNQQVSGVSDPLPTPKGAVLEYISQDPLVHAGGLYQVSERGRLTQQAWSGEDASDGSDARYPYEFDGPEAHYPYGNNGSDSHYRAETMDLSIILVSISLIITLIIDRCSYSMCMTYN